jgi:hypothetical protein
MDLKPVYRQEWPYERPARQENQMSTTTYKGYGSGSASGGRLVTVIIDGEESPLPHIVRHSPTGMTWGYGGSGPADLALSLLVHALGDAAKCRTCRGTAQVMYDVRADADIPYDLGVLTRDRERYSAAGRCGDCEAGVPRGLPYQAFKFEVVAALHDSWTMTRDEILAWHREHETQGAAR